MFARILRVFLVSAVIGIFTANASALANPDYMQRLDEARSEMMRDPNEVLTIAQTVQNEIEAQKPSETLKKALTKSLWLQSEALTRLGRPLDALPIAERALNEIDAREDNSKLYADVLVSRARIAKAIGDYQTALIRFREAFDVFIALEDARSQAIVLQSIGSIYTAAMQNDQAIDYFARASELYQDPSLELAAANNRAGAYKNLGKYDEALVEFQSALAIANEINSPILQARILNNIAALHVAFKHYKTAQNTLDDAFEKVANVPQGEWARFLHGVQAQIEYERGDLEKARTNLERTIDAIPLDQTTQHFSEFHSLGAEIYSDLGHHELALEHFKAFKRLDDDARDIAASANSALLAAEFDFASQDLEIEQLRGAQLEQSLQIEQTRARMRFTIAVGLVLISLVIGGLGWLRLHMSQIRQKVLTRTLYEDAETGLLTRYAFHNHVKRRKKEDDDIYVIAIRLDRYSHLNGVLGFKRIARLTKALAECIGRVVGPDNIGLIAPGVLGVVTQIDGCVESEAPDALKKMGEKLHNVLSRPQTIDGLNVDVNATIGAIAYKRHESITQAMIAIDQAAEDHTRFAIFDQERYGNPSQNLTLMTQMLDAIQDGHIKLHYQPKLNLKTGEFDGAEALCRWTDPERGAIKPDQFIPFAEQTGHIRALTEWMLNRLVIDQLSLRKAGIDINLSINISGVLLCDKAFARKAAQLVARTTGTVTFEVTEGAVLFDLDKAIHSLELWSKAGIKIAIDDYGTGRSSLAYLRNIPADEIKLDQIFVSDLETSRASRMMVKSTIDLAHNLGLQLTAAGVENNRELDILRPMGCDWVQGFGLVKPKPLIDMIGFLQHGNDDSEHDKVIKTN